MREIAFNLLAIKFHMICFPRHWSLQLQVSVCRKMQKSTYKKFINNLNLKTCMESEIRQKYMKLSVKGTTVIKISYLHHFNLNLQTFSYVQQIARSVLIFVRKTYHFFPSQFHLKENMPEKLANHTSKKLMVKYQNISIWYKNLHSFASRQRHHCIFVVCMHTMEFLLYCSSVMFIFVIVSVRYFCFHYVCVRSIQVSRMYRWFPTKTSRWKTENKICTVFGVCAVFIF